MGGAVTILWIPAPLMFFLPSQAGAPTGNGWAALMAACYLPLVLWGPLLGAVTWAYYQRRCKAPVSAAVDHLAPQRSSHLALRRSTGGEATGSGVLGAGRS